MMVQMPPHSLEDIIANKAEIPGIEHPLPLFHEYLKSDYYPFESDVDFEIESKRISVFFGSFVLKTMCSPPLVTICTYGGYFLLT